MRFSIAFKSEDVRQALVVYSEVRDHGFDSLFFINGLAQYIRDLMVARDPLTVKLLEATDDVRLEMANRAQSLPPEFFYRAMNILGNADLNFRSSSNKQFLTELTLIKLCQLLSPSTPAMTPRGS